MPFTIEELQRPGDIDAFKRAFAQKLLDEPGLTLNANVVFSNGSPREENLKGPIPPLHYCALKGLIAPLTVLLQLKNDRKYPVDINLHDDFKLTALHYACREGRMNVVSDLLKSGASFNGYSNDSHPFNLLSPANKINLLHSACENGWLEVVRALATLGVDLRTRKEGEDWTPLHRAANSGRLAVVEELLSKGVEKESVTADGSTALHMAAASVHPEVVSCLIRNGANVLALKNRSNHTPLLQLLQGDYNSTKSVAYTEIVTTFLACPGYQINGKRSEVSERITTSRVQDTYLTIAIKLKYPENIIKLLLTKVIPGSSILNHLCRQGTALHIAIEERHTTIIPLLLSMGADLATLFKAAQQDQIGETPFYRLVEKGTKIDSLKQYLELYSSCEHNPNKKPIVELIAFSQSVKKHNLLHLAAGKESVELLQFLLEQFDLNNPEHRKILRDALNAVDDAGNTSQRVAAIEKKSDNFRLLEEYNQKLIAAAKSKESLQVGAPPPPLPLPTTSSGSEPSSARNTVASLHEQVRTLLYPTQAKAIVYTDNDEENTNDIFDHISSHPYHYLVATLIFTLAIFVGFFAACAFWPVVAAAIPIVTGVANTLVAAKIASASLPWLPILAKVVTTVLPLLATLVVGIMVGIAYGLFKAGDWFFNDILLADASYDKANKFSAGYTSTDGMQYKSIPSGPPTPKPNFVSTHATLSALPPAQISSTSATGSASQGGGSFNNVLYPTRDSSKVGSGDTFELRDLSQYQESDTRAKP